MQFGVGILGRGWTAEATIQRQLENTRPAGKNMHLHASCYAAKLAAESVFYDPPQTIDLSDDGLIARLALCARPVRRSEVGMIRDAYLAEYGHLLEAS